MSEHHKKEDYQYFLGIFADAIGYPGSPTMDEVLHRASEMKALVYRLAETPPAGYNCEALHSKARHLLKYGK